MILCISALLPLSCFFGAASEQRVIVADDTQRPPFVAKPGSALSGFNTSLSITILSRR